MFFVTSQRGMIVWYYWLILDYYYNFDIAHIMEYLNFRKRQKIIKSGRTNQN